MRLQNRCVLGSTVLAFTAALVLAGCGAGQITQTDSQEPAVNGASAQVKTLYIRNAELQFPPTGTAYPAGSSAALSLVVINVGERDDALVSVTSDVAAGTAIQGSQVVVAGHSLVIAPPSASVDGTAPGSSASTPNSGASAAATSTVGRGAVVLLGLKRPVWPGQTIRVTFVFRDAGPVDVDMPIGSPSHSGAGDVHAEAAPTASAGR